MFFAADVLDAEPNQHITVHWGLAPSSQHPAERISALVNKLGTWLRRNEAKVVWAYAREVNRTKSEHLHLVAHVPAKLAPALPGLVKRWVESGAVGQASDRAISIRHVFAGDLRRSHTLSLRRGGRTTDLRTTGGDLKPSLRSYLLKESDVRARSAWVHPHHKAAGGSIEGKRLKVSHSIDRRARQKAGWRAS